MEDLYNAPISIGDAVALLKKKVGKNDRPYMAGTSRLNNERVDRWKNEVLEKVADHNGTVPSGKVWGLWKLYDEGQGVLRYRALKDAGMIPDIDPEVLEYWKDFFENLSVEEIHEYGSGVVSFGWGIIQNYFKMWYADQKYEKLFSVYDAPIDWEKNSVPHKSLLNGEILPFWTEEILKDVQEKVWAVLSNEVKPQDATGFR